MSAINHQCQTSNAGLYHNDLDSDPDSDESASILSSPIVTTRLKQRTVGNTATSLLTDIEQHSAVSVLGSIVLSSDSDQDIEGSDSDNSPSLLSTPDVIKSSVHKPKCLNENRPCKPLALKKRGFTKLQFIENDTKQSKKNNRVESKSIQLSPSKSARLSLGHNLLFSPKSNSSDQKTSSPNNLVNLKHKLPASVSMFTPISQKLSSVSYSMHRNQSHKSHESPDGGVSMFTPIGQKPLSVINSMQRNQSRKSHESPDVGDSDVAASDSIISQWSEVDDSCYLKLADDSPLTVTTAGASMSSFNSTHNERHCHRQNANTGTPLFRGGVNRSVSNISNVSNISQWSEVDDEQYMTLELSDISNMTTANQVNNSVAIATGCQSTMSERAFSPDVQSQGFIVKKKNLFDQDETC